MPFKIQILRFFSIAALVDHFWLIDYSKQSVFLRLTQNSTEDLEPACMNRILCVIAAIVVLVYQVRVEAKGLKKVEMDTNQTILRILSLLLPLAMLFTSFYSVFFTPTKSKSAVPGRIVITLVIWVIISVILPIMFIASNKKMKDFVRRFWK